MTTPPPDPEIHPEHAAELAPGVHVIPDGGVPLVPNVGLIEGRDAVLVVDCGLGPANGARVLDWARGIAKGRTLHLALTHFHPEHGFGAQAFKGQAQIIVNRRQLDEFRDKAEAYLEMFRGFGPAVARQLDGTVLVEPDLVHEGRLDLDLGGRRVSLEEIGPAHTRGDQVIWLPEERVLFTGDLAEHGIFPIFPWFPGQDTDLDAIRWQQALEDLAARGDMRVVPGHGGLSDTTLLRAIGEYMTDMRAAVRAGLDVPAIEAQFHARYPDWQGREWVAFAARHYQDTSA